jgi:hypothetical protein
MLHLLTKRTSFLKLVYRDSPLEEIVEMKATNFRWFSVALDESTKVSDTRKVPVFVRKIDMEFSTAEK